MSLTETIVRCPYCQRQYTMKLDREEIERRKSRATCGRCGKSFELASRIVVPGASRLAPPASAPITRSNRTPPAGVPSPAAELDALTREIMAAADAIAIPQETAPPLAASVPAPAPPVAPPPLAPVDDDYDIEVSAPASEPVAAAAPPPPVAPPRPLTWLERADPGLAGLADADADAQRVIARVLA